VAYTISKTRSTALLNELNNQVTCQSDFTVIDFKVFMKAELPYVIENKFTI
jgi:hypothetical protein